MASKTRVVALYDSRWGRDVYYVDRFADFDSIGSDGRKMVNTTTGLYWRRVQAFMVRKDAEVYAINLSKAPDDAPKERVLFMFSGGHRQVEIKDD
jgi:hypothetical protein